MLGTEQANSVLRRDYTATTISTIIRGTKALLVNGIGMTYLCTIAKLMVHLPMAFHEGTPKSILVICFGMGTTFRSALSWDTKVTIAELLPTVRDSFGYYHADTATALKNPNGHIVIDDGRRFLRRTKEKFDVITLDPPPPPEAAASSLLYSKEFYQLVQKHLNPGGILQQWYGFPKSEGLILQAVMRSLIGVFPYVRMYPAFRNPDGKEIAGWYLLASDSPIKALSGSEMVARMPEKAKQDLYEWSTSSPLEKEMKDLVNAILSHQIFIDPLLSPLKEVVITDDHPMNEYYWLRRHLAGQQVFLPY